MEEWSQSLLTALLNSLKNPQLYWVFILSFFVVSHVRNEQRVYFGKALYSKIHTWLKTFSFAIISGIILSAITLSFGLIFTYEIIVILCVVTFILSVGYRSKFLSISFILGFTYILLLPTNLNFYDKEAHTLFISMTMMIGLLLLVEAHSISRMKTKDLSPEVRMSRRGSLIGRFSFEKITFIPFFIFVPGETLLPFLPVFSFGDGLYSLALVPFVFGFQYRTNNHFPQVAFRKIAKQTAFLGGIVLIGSGISMMVPLVNYIVVIIAIIGQLYIHVSASMEENSHQSAFLGLEQKAKVFWIDKGSIAEAAGIQIGDTITAINDKAVENTSDVDRLLLRLPPGRREFTVVNYLNESRSIMIVDPVYNRYDFGIRFID